MLKDPGAGVRYYRTGSAASAMGPALLDGVPVADARAVLVTGVTALIGAAAARRRARASRIGARTPNRRSKSASGLWGSDRRAELVRPFIERCDLLLAGVARARGTARRRAGAGSAGQAGAAGAAARPAARAPARRDRAKSSSAAPSTIGVLAPMARGARLDIRRGAAVDPIGAGDAFNAGYIAVRLRGGTIDDALRAGARCGAAVTSALSDTSGFPRTL